MILDTDAIVAAYNYCYLSITIIYIHRPIYIWGGGYNVVQTVVFFTSWADDQIWPPYISIGWSHRNFWVSIFFVRERSPWNRSKNRCLSFSNLFHPYSLPTVSRKERDIQAYNRSLDYRKKVLVEGCGSLQLLWNCHGFGDKLTNKPTFFLRVVLKEIKFNNNHFLGAQSGRNSFMSDWNQNVHIIYGMEIHAYSKFYPFLILEKWNLDGPIFIHFSTGRVPSSDQLQLTAPKKDPKTPKGNHCRWGDVPPPGFHPTWRFQ